MLKMIAIGNLTGDPVLKTNEETGKPYAIMRIASDRRYKSPDGEKLTDFAPSPAITHNGEAELAMPCTSMLLDSILPAIVAVMLLNSTWLSYASFALS